MIALAATVKHFLDYHRISYRVLNHERTLSLAMAASLLEIEPSHIIKAVLLQDSLGYVLAVLPLNYQMDLLRLSQQLDRRLNIVPEKECDKLFKDCEPGIRPPFGEAYGVPLILDKSIEKLSMLYLEAGSHTALIQLSSEDFRFLTSGMPILSFGYQEGQPEAAEDQREIVNGTKPWLKKLQNIFLPN